MNPFVQLTYDRFCQSIDALDAEMSPDIYVFSLLYGTYWSAEATGRQVAFQGEIQLTYNTLSHFATQIKRASSASEAKWDLAFWLGNLLAASPRQVDYGSDPPDDEFALRDDWCASLGIVSDDRDESGRPVYKENALYDAIRQACQEVVPRLHHSGVIGAKFGKPIPVLIAGPDQPYGANAEATRAVNPPELIHEWEEWQRIRKRGG